MVHFNGTEAQPANQPELQQPASRSSAIRLLATLGFSKSLLAARGNPVRRTRSPLIQTSLCRILRTSAQFYLVGKKAEGPACRAIHVPEAAEFPALPQWPRSVLEALQCLLVFHNPYVSLH